MSRYTSIHHNTTRDSLELASLASSSTPHSRHSNESSSSGAPSSRKLSLEQEDPLDSHNTAARPTRHNRAFSVSSAFDFTSNLFPLTSTASDGYARIGDAIAPSEGATGPGSGSLEKHKTLTYLNGLSLIIGLIIGSGIFSSPGQVIIRAGSPAASLIVWVVAGVLAWTGAASYAELGGAIPLNGGPQVYLSKIFGEVFGFLFTWCAVLVLKPGSTAIIAIIFGEYFVRAIVGADAETVSPWINKGVALFGLLVVTMVNCLSTKLGTRMGDGFMFLKFIALLAVTVIGVVVAITGFSWDGNPSVEWKSKTWWTEGTSTDVSSWAVALYSGLWAFDGWDNTNYVVGEFVNPSRDLPRVIHTAMPLVITCYLAANIAYFFVLPLSSITSTNTVAVLFGSKVFGSIGSLLLSLVVSASCLGALNATAFTSGRLIYAAGKEGYLPKLMGHIGFGRSSPDELSTLRTQNFISRRLSKMLGEADTGLFFTPVNALLFNALITVVYIIIGDFSTLLTFYGVAGYTFYFLTVLGLIVLRVREPHLERPYKTWISTPIIFCCVSLFLLSRAVFAEPVQTLIVLAFVVSGVPVYYWRVRGRDWGRKPPSREGGRKWYAFWKR